MTKHTAGTWAFAKYSAKRFGLGRRGEGAFFFLQCVYGSADDPQARADARLIAAAPDLLEALQLAMPALESMRKQWPRCTHDDSLDVLQTARAAIAKATGNNHE